MLKVHPAADAEVAGTTAATTAAATTPSRARTCERVVFERRNANLLRGHSLASGPAHATRRRAARRGTQSGRRTLAPPAGSGGGPMIGLDGSPDGVRAAGRPA